MDRIELGDQVEVQIDVFSGRPNPCWTLRGESVRALEQALGSLQPDSARQPPGLGYRGMVVVSPGLELRAFDSVLTLRRGGTETSFRDTGGLESRLLAQAREHGFGELLSGATHRGGAATT
jgi:hypothetical protein